MEKHATYTSGFNCRSYYQCNSRGRSMAMCCRNKQTFNPNLGRCVRDDSCDIDCTYRQPYKKSRKMSPSAAREAQRNIMQNMKVNLQVTETYDCKYCENAEPNLYLCRALKKTSLCLCRTVVKLCTVSSSLPTLAK